VIFIERGMEWWSAAFAAVLGILAFNLVLREKSPRLSKLVGFLVAIAVWISAQVYKEFMGEGWDDVARHYVVRGICSSTGTCKPGDGKAIVTSKLDDKPFQAPQSAIPAHVTEQTNQTATAKSVAPPDSAKAKSETPPPDNAKSVAPPPEAPAKSVPRQRSASLEPRAEPRKVKTISVVGDSSVTLPPLYPPTKPEIQQRSSYSEPRKIKTVSVVGDSSETMPDVIYPERWYHWNSADSRKIATISVASADPSNPTADYIFPTTNVNHQPAMGAGPTSKTEIAKALQGELRRVGCSNGLANGNWNATSQNALGLFNRYANTRFEVKVASMEALAGVKIHTERVCPLVCETGFSLDGDHCVKSDCPTGQRRNKWRECEGPDFDTLTDDDAQPSSAKPNLFQKIFGNR
jgi:hypothetical protein